MTIGSKPDRRSITLSKDDRKLIRNLFTDLVLEEVESDRNQPIVSPLQNEDMIDAEEMLMMEEQLVRSSRRDKSSPPASLSS